jgi:hypothetical protein
MYSSARSKSRGIAMFGRSGLAALVALVRALLVLPSAASAADGGISGKVTFVGGAATAAAEVCAEGAGELDFGCTTSDINGDYQVLGLEPGNYVVTFEATESSPYVVFKRYATDVTVASGATTPGIDAAVTKGGAITGTVKDAVTGALLAEVEVSSIWENEFDGFDLTGGDGSFELIGLHPGLHEIEFWSWQGKYETRFLNLPIAAGSTVNASAFLVPKPPVEGRIGGHVFALATRQPLAGIAVCAIDDFDESEGCAHTNKAGAFEFVGVPAGQWRIAYSPAVSEFEAFEPGEIVTDAWPTQFWNMKTTLAQADVIQMFQGLTVGEVDGFLGPGASQAQSSPGGTGSSNAAVPPPYRAPVAVTPKPKPLKCGKGKVKKSFKGKQRCVKRHKARHHRQRHH